MNTKRQTIWLVSMLSLMVVLSAYYLFTEDVNKLDVASDATHQEDVKVTTQEDPAGGKDKAVGGTEAAGAVKTDSSKTDAKPADPRSEPKPVSPQPTEGGKASPQPTDSGKASPKPTDSGKTQPQASAAPKDNKSTDAKATDAQVISQLESQASAKSGADYIIQQQLKRSDDLAEQTGKLLAIINDTKNSSDTIAKAYDDMSKLEQQEAKQSHIEEVLSKDYAQALLTKEESKWKVIVQTNKLERSQALSIIDLVMSELNVGPEKVSVQAMQ
ncbi:SpoIIIAH-like family protein [Paenibacillus aurantius]|uniref:SpoIIIAH-like family protein n=1 Tax=Paenibacillus aurantius TaxID=2918900 RepID=A0AA96L9B7_9BACL|nr:SpoIIIAH-like family protein [Paenibacillus aurantius]WJH34292.1 SpoIIIAH-like family protein [Paenibacillus sp. CC-CFT747]WNQ09397.1 SpoIIIAH-like family protein [Paenibacillus aurantius]